MRKNQGSKLSTEGLLKAICWPKWTVRRSTS